MRRQGLIPTLFLFIAWLLALLALIAGRNGQLINLHAIGANVSRAGLDILTDTTLFNLDNSNILYTIWASATNQSASTRPGNRPQSSDVRTSSNKSAVIRLTQEAEAPPLSLPNYLIGFWDKIADSLTLDHDGILYSMGQKVLTTVGSDIELETGEFVEHIKKRVTKDVARVLARSLTTSATEDSMSRSRHTDLQSVNFSRTKALLLAETSAAGHNHTLRHFFKYLDLNRLSGQPVQTVQRSLTDTLASNIADIMVNGTSARTPLASLIRENKPIIAHTVRATVNSFLNEQVTNIRKGFNLPAWAAMYQTQWCWGQYTRKGLKTVTACADGSVLDDLNLAPGLRRTLDSMDYHGHMPERVDLPTGLQKSFEGMQQFTHAVYAAMITLVVLTGLSFLMSFINVFIPERWNQASDFFTLGLCVASGGFTLLVGGPYAVFEYFAGLTVPGLASLFNVGYDGGWRFVALLAGSELMTLIGMGYWIVLERKGYRDKFMMETIVIAKRDTRMMGIGNMDQTIKFGM